MVKLIKGHKYKCIKDIKGLCKKTIYFKVGNVYDCVGCNMLISEVKNTCYIPSKEEDNFEEFIEKKI